MALFLSAVIWALVLFFTCCSKPDPVPCSYYRSQADYWTAQADSVQRAWGDSTEQWVKGYPAQRNFLDEYRRRAARFEKLFLDCNP